MRIYVLKYDGYWFLPGESSMSVHAYATERKALAAAKAFCRSRGLDMNKFEVVTYRPVGPLER